MAKIKVNPVHQVAAERFDDPSGAFRVEKRVVIGEKEGAKGFIMRVFSVEPGGYSPYHRHDWEHEVIVLRGKGEVVTEEGPICVEERTAVFVPANAVHQFRNTGEETFEFVCVIPAHGQ
ncbi:MAG TPA: cupin domain-containing protein [Thermotogota bacterium]|nr:cupin domain-containing protein [Thermotogota bacterium]HRW91764.1 cupin domain-containing protein [Thermotogota bacterium]